MPRQRLALLIAVLAAGAVVAALVLGGDDGPTDGSSPFAQGTAPATPLPSRCLDTPERIATPEWFPRDLPLPKGSFATEIPPARDPTRAIVFAAGSSLKGWVDHVLAEWPKEGWEFVSGETEPGEAEAAFTDARGERFGSFVARTVYCDQDRTLVLLQLVLERQPPPTPVSTG